MKGSECNKARRNYHLTILAGIVGLALVITLVFFRNYEDFGEFMLSFVWALVLCATLWLGNSYIYGLSLIHISEPTRLRRKSRMPSSA